MVKEKIELRKLKMSDSDVIYSLYKNDAVLKNLAFPLKAKDLTKKMENNWVKNVIANYKKKEPDGYDMGLTVNGELIGVIGVPRVNWKNNSAEIGYWIGEEYWGRGYTTEGVKKFTKHLFKKFKFKRIEIKAYSRNAASIRVAEKCGFKFEGIHRCAVRKHGKYLDEHVYSKIRE